MKFRIFLILGTLLLVHSTAAIAHHSFTATFTRGESTTVEGTVTKFSFKNPHVLIYLDVTDESGEVTNWMIESHSATSWRREGWEKDMLKAGDVLRINGNPSNDGSPMVWIDTFEYLDPESKAVIATLSAKQPLTSASTEVADVEQSASKKSFQMPLAYPDGTPNFTGITRQNRALSPKSGGPDGDDIPHPYNETGKQALAAFDISDDPQIFCDMPGVVRQAGYTPYGQMIQQYPDHITIKYEEYGSLRAVFFNDTVPGPGPRSRLGDSVARYEGDTLIIETVNLLANTSGHRGTPLSDNHRVVEKYTRADTEEFGPQVRTETTVYDDKYFSEPWTVVRTKMYDPSYEFIENECVAPLRDRPKADWQD